MIDELIERVESGEVEISPALQRAIDETRQKFREELAEGIATALLRAHKEQHDGR